MDLLRLFQSFYENTEFDHQFSKSFISLIAKVKGLATLNIFVLFHFWVRSISL